MIESFAFVTLKADLSPTNLSDMVQDEMDPGGSVLSNGLLLVNSSLRVVEMMAVSRYST